MKRKISVVAMSVLYIGAGINHFLNTDFYLKIIPYYFPYREALVYVSGVVEYVLGILLLFHKTRKVATWLIISMLTLFLTVHIQMIIDQFKLRGLLFWIAVIRLPLQFVLIRWAYVLRNTDFARYSKGK